MSELQKKIRTNTLVRTVFRTAPEAVLVGGYIRDVFSGDERCNDYDFILKKGIRGVVKQLQSNLGGTIVELGREGIVRLALKGDRHLDFSRMQGSLSGDMDRRDFTVNALAWTPSDGIIDLHNGTRDIEKGTIRAVSEKNIIDDPLRLLRAYRFMAEKGWKIENKTRKMVQRHSRLIRKVASERITYELFHTMQAPWADMAIRQCLEDGLLHYIITLKNNVLQHNVNVSHQVLVQLEKLPQRIRLKKFPQELTYAGLLRLERLALGAKPDDCQLSLSRPVEARLKRTSELFLRFEEISNLNAEEVFDLFNRAGDAAVDLLVLTGNTKLYPELRRFNRIQSHPILGTEEMMSAIGLDEGPEVGRALEKMKQLQFRKIIKNKRQALSKLKYLKRYSL